jgi:hypothetical protein
MWDDSLTFGDQYPLGELFFKKYFMRARTLPGLKKRHDALQNTFFKKYPLGELFFKKFLCSLQTEPVSGKNLAE